MFSVLVMAQGQKAIMVTEEFFGNINKVWQAKKGEIVTKYDVTTAAAFARKLIERGLREEEIDGRFEIVKRLDNGIIVRDYFLAKDAEITIAVEGPYGVLRCNLDNTGKCPHVGFVLSDPGLVNIAKERGLTLRRAPKSTSISEGIGYFKKFAGAGEISDSDFIEKLRNETGMDELEAKELLKALYQYGDIRKTRVVGEKYYFVATSTFE